jgi:hypothetical protein
MSSKVKLPDILIDKLSELPEQGMGYQVVIVTLKNGEILIDRRVANCSYLLLEANEIISTDDIVDIELYKNE